MFTSRPWRARTLASDFAVLDEWDVPVIVPADSFRDFVQVFLSNAFEGDSRLAGALFRLRFALGRVLGWDAGPALPIPGCTETTVAARLTDDDRARDQSATLAMAGIPGGARAIYLFDDEAVLEIANKTIHALIHLGRVPSGSIRLTVLIKSRGRLSNAYMALIGPFRHKVVYPALFRSIRRAWEQRPPS